MTVTDFVSVTILEISALVTDYPKTNLRVNLPLSERFIHIRFFNAGKWYPRSQAHNQKPKPPSSGHGGDIPGNGVVTIRKKTLFG